MKKHLVWLLIALLWCGACALAGCVALRSAATGVALPVPVLAGAPAAEAPARQSSRPEGAVGYLRVTIRWPIRAQLIPSDTNAIALEVKDASGSRLAYGEFARPQDSARTSATLSVPVAGNLTVEVGAYREAAGSLAGASPIAKGTLSGVEIKRARFSDVKITLASLSAPAIESLSSNVGAVGDPITIKGANLAPTQPDGAVSTPSVEFAGGATADVTPKATDEVQVVVPAGATCGALKVKVGNQAVANPPTFYVTSGVKIRLADGATDSLNPEAATDTVIVLDDSTKSFAADAGFVFPTGSGSADFPDLPATVWLTSASQVGLMGQGGVFKATESLPAGVTDTTVTAEVVPKRSNPVLVRVLVVSVSVSPPTESINVPAPAGQPSAGYPASASLTATVSNNLNLGGVADVTWASSDLATVSVSGGGIVSAVARGSAVITARSVVDPRRLATASVEVTAKGGLNVEIR